MGRLRLSVNSNSWHQQVGIFSRNFVGQHGFYPLNSYVTVRTFSLFLRHSLAAAETAAEKLPSKLNERANESAILARGLVHRGEYMKAVAIRNCVLNVFCCALLAASAMAQRSAAVKPVAGSYDIANDVSVQGTVLNYTEKSAALPIGTHLLVQTASGNVDVHLGDARLLHLANLKIALGANVRLIGQPKQIGANSVFLARLVQVGTKVLAVRSEQGFLYGPAGIHAEANKALTANARADQRAGAR